MTGTSQLFAIDRAAIDKKRIAEDEATVSYKVRITREGVMNGEFQSADEVRKLAPFANGLPIVRNHPEDENPVIMQYDSIEGYTDGAQVVDFEGVVVVEGVAYIYKDEGADMIKDIDGGKLSAVSYGYFYDRKDKGGDFNGEKFTHTRENILPAHLAALDGIEPACPLPDCGIGVDRRKVFIRPARLNDNKNMPRKGDANMTGENDNQTAAPAKVQDMSLDALKDMIPCVRKLADSHDAQKADLEKAADALKTSEVEKAELKKAADELAGIRKAELDELRVKVAALKSGDKAIFEESDVEGMDKSEMERHLKAADAHAKADGEDGHAAPPFPPTGPGQAGDMPQVGMPDPKNPGQFVPIE